MSEVRYLAPLRVVDDATDVVLHEGRVDSNGGYAFGERWCWRCSCGGHGRWGGQSDTVAAFGWWRHAWRALGMTWPVNADPAYRWLTQERRLQAEAREARKEKRRARSTQ